MSTVFENMTPPRENVYVLNEMELIVISYDDILEDTYYCIPLISGSYSVYQKTNLFDDEIIQKVSTKEQAVELLNNLNMKNG